MEALPESLQRLRDQVAIVTGASRGIGRAIALALAAEGAKIAVNYASSSAAAEEIVGSIEAAGGSAIALQADVSKTDGVEALINGTKKMGPSRYLDRQSGPA